MYNGNCKGRNKKNKNKCESLGQSGTEDRELGAEWKEQYLGAGGGDIIGQRIYIYIQ